MHYVASGVSSPFHPAGYRIPISTSTFLSPTLFCSVKLHERPQSRSPNAPKFWAGLELGGVPVATALSLATGIPAVFVRKKAKPYGTAKLAEGVEIEGRRVLVIEDVIRPEAK